MQFFKSKYNSCKRGIKSSSKSCTGTTGNKIFLFHFRTPCYFIYPFTYESTKMY